MVRHVSVDSVLRGTSEIPSGQMRGNPLAYLHRARAHGSSSSYGRPTPPRPVNPRRTVNQGQLLPSRSTKVSEKLVLIPETEEDDSGRWDYQEEDEEGPLRDDEEESRQSPEEGEETAGKLPPRKSYAERLPKSRRAEKFARVTAYCTADAYRLKNVSNFLREVHGARTKLYDECLYVAYHLPLLAGIDGYRIRSSPALKNPGGKPVLDVEIERSEHRNYHEGYFDEGYRGRRDSVEEDQEARHDNPPTDERTYVPREASDQEHRPESPKEHQSAMDMTGIAEMFVFSYGVVVFWNFTERQEKDILADLTFAPQEDSPLIIGPLREEDFETEEFHFEYSSKTRSPRIYNDMITLRSGDIMIKLAISHAIAQSTKLCRFEESMNSTMAGVEHIPKKLALTGTLGMKREEVIKMTGRLFRLRVDVNLSSNVLDVPEFFWAEPSLHPLYTAVREYLEIQPRVTVLNSRCGVFLDLADMLTDSIADSNMSRITWIIIWLILLSIMVTVAEVTIRFGILSGHKDKSGLQTLGSGVLLGISEI
ncbi:hypothetical protein FN846DRAFT_786874 [Sphaerosporella brunnea]|uniref:DUF155 domain-containing protein n=1 Tax=Sphaerosporella brunnea TaxID=1250544 RepID=A0A5J5EGV1_9PEZI|nr:hypothetical protein FN846DRAFT_786874 [Sphaerosporella brunnea]